MRFYFLLLWLTLAFIPAPLWAEAKPVVPPALVMNPETDLSRKASSPEDIAFHFHRAASVKPDFVGLISNTPSFQKADKATQDIMLRDDVAVLEMGFHNFVPDANPIIVRTKVTVKPVLGRQNGFVVGFAGQTQNPQKPQNPIYFPYLWGGQNFAVLADGIEQFSFLPMKMDTASAMSGKINKDWSGTFIFELKPISADAQKPFTLDGVSQWLLMTKIVKASLVNEYLEVLWQYEAKN